MEYSPEKPVFANSISLDTELDAVQDHIQFMADSARKSINTDIVNLSHRINAVLTPVPPATALDYPTFEKPKPLLDRVYDWAVDDVANDHFSSDNDLFGSLNSDRKFDVMQLPADKQGLFANYQSTGKPTQASKGPEARIIELFKTHEQNDALRIFTSPERQKIPKLTKLVGAVALAGSLLAAGFGVSHNHTTSDSKVAAVTAHTVNANAFKRIVTPATSTPLANLNLPNVTDKQPIPAVAGITLVKTEVSVAPKAPGIQKPICETNNAQLLANVLGVPADKVLDTMEYLMNAHNTTVKGAAHLTGNFIAESRLNPAAKGDGGQAKGIAQWHPDRRPNGLPAGLLGQLDYALKEMPTSGGAALVHSIKDPNATYAQLQNGIKSWERYGAEANRGNYAKNILKLVGCKIKPV